MMKFLRQPIIAVGVIVCLLFIGAAFAVESPAHAFHHAHHKSSTHGSLLCSWMCAAGQVDSTSNLIVEIPSFESERLEGQTYLAPSRILVRTVFPRGPPHS